MSDRIDPSGYQDGTILERSDGSLVFKDGQGWQLERRDLGDGSPFPWREDFFPVRAYEPLPTPGQEVPWDEWDTLPEGAVIRVETDYGVTLVGPVRDRTVSAILIGSIGARHVVPFRGITRLCRLDTPHDPTPADLIGADQVAALEAAGWAITRAER